MSQGAPTQFIASYLCAQTTALNSTIPLPYLDEGLLRRWQTEPAVPTSEKLDALVFVRAACASSDSGFNW